MESDRDRRVRRTRNALIEAFRALLVEKGYDAMTVADIIDRADVGRSTFYNHFTNKADFLDHSLKGLDADVRSRAPAEASPPDRPLRFSLGMNRHINTHRRVALAAAGPGGGPVKRAVERILAKMVREELASLADGPPRIPLEVTVQLIVAAYLATATWWLVDAPDHTPEEVDAIFQDLIAPTVRAGLNPATPAGPASPTASSSG